MFVTLYELFILYYCIFKLSLPSTDSSAILFCYRVENWLGHYWLRVSMPAIMSWGGSTIFGSRLWGWFWGWLFWRWYYRFWLSTSSNWWCSFYCMYSKELWETTPCESWDLLSVYIRSKLPRLFAAPLRSPDWKFPFRISEMLMWPFFDLLGFLRRAEWWPPPSENCGW